MANASFTLTIISYASSRCFISRRLQKKHPTLSAAYLMHPPLTLQLTLHFGTLRGPTMMLLVTGLQQYSERLNLSFCERQLPSTFLQCRMLYRSMCRGVYSYRDASDIDTNSELQKLRRRTPSTLSQSCIKLTAPIVRSLSTVVKSATTTLL